MRILIAFLYIIFPLSVGLNLYLWLFEIPRLKAIIYDLNEENSKILKNLKPQRSTQEDGFTSIIFPSDDIFDLGSAEISENGKAKLDSLLVDLKKGFEKIEVAVYTDKSPVRTNKDKYPTNWELAGARASAVVRYFISKGVNPEKLSAISYGDSKSKGKGADERKVEIRVY